jgi:hypothetical protein
MLLTGSLITWIILFIENKLFDRNRENRDYVKIITLVDIVLCIVIYLLQWLSPSSNNIINGYKPKILNAGVIKLPVINEDIMTDNYID